ncbi:MAG: hypothetical protein FWC69_01225 [Defluviitaleaceae bacterium]|nr:hypothetical protein [Defluviitaleaceae bacterium]
MSDYRRILGFEQISTIESSIQWINIIIMVFVIALLVMVFMLVFRKWRKEFFSDEAANKNKLKPKERGEANDEKMD